MRFGIAVHDLAPGRDGTQALDAQLLWLARVLLGIGGEFRHDDFGVGDCVLAVADLLEHLPDHSASAP